MELSGKAIMHVCGWFVCSALQSGKPHLQGSFLCNVVTCITLLCMLQCLFCSNAGETGYFSGIMC